MVPWAIGSPSDAIAFLWAGQLVAGPSPRRDGTNNKILWVAKNAEWGFAVKATPLGQTEPILTVEGGPSIVDAPSPGCWAFRLTRNSDGKLISTINLQVLPQDTLPG